MFSLWRFMVSFILPHFSDFSDISFLQFSISCFVFETPSLKVFISVSTTSRRSIKLLLKFSTPFICARFVAIKFCFSIISPCRLSIPFERVSFCFAISSCSSFIESNAVSISSASLFFSSISAFCFSILFSRSIFLSFML